MIEVNFLPFFLYFGSYLDQSVLPIYLLKQYLLQKFDLNLVVLGHPEST